MASTPNDPKMMAVLSFVILALAISVIFMLMIVSELDDTITKLKGLAELQGRTIEFQRDVIERQDETIKNFQKAMGLPL